MTKLECYLIFIILSLNVDASNVISQDVLSNNSNCNAKSSRYKNKACVVEAKGTKSAGDRDGQFLNYMSKFIDTEGGKLLHEILDTHSEQTDTNHGVVQHKVGLRANFDYLNIILLILLSTQFLYVLFYCPLSMVSVVLTTDLLTLLLFGLMTDIANKWTTFSLAIVFSVALSFGLHNVTNIHRRQASILSICTLFSKLIYDLHAGIPLDSINPGFTGIAGLIVNYLFMSTNVFLVRIIYLIFILAITYLIFRLIPTYVTEEPMELHEVEFSTWERMTVHRSQKSHPLLLFSKIMKRLICFTCSWPVASLVQEIISSLISAPNPLSPFNYYMVPTKLRMDCVETYTSLSVWIITFVLLSVVTTERSNDPDPEVRKSKSWRGSTKSVSLS